MPSSKMSRKSGKHARKTSLSKGNPSSEKGQGRDTTPTGLRLLGALYSALLLCVLAATSSYVNRLALSPIYGSIPSYLHYEKGLFFSALVGWLVNSILSRPPSIRPQGTNEHATTSRSGQQNDYRSFLPVISTMTPSIQQYVSDRSTILGAHWGPLVTQFFTSFPLVMLSFATIQARVSRSRKTGGLLQTERGSSGLIVESVGFFAFYFAFRKTDETLASVAWNYQLIGRNLLFNRLPLQIAAALAYTVCFIPAKRIFHLVLWPCILYNVLFNPHIPSPKATARLKSTLISSQHFILHDRVESLTGYLSVVEDIKRGFKVMRCDHSLLGGQWISLGHGNNHIWPINASEPVTVGEPTYAVFVMLEAVRLVKHDSLTTQKKPDYQSSALVIGLGIGTTPTALAAHGIRTTAVEIDGAVDILARKHFDLPNQVQSVIEDAADFVESAAGRGQKYDYIVHDVFTGGAEPIELFTKKFLQDLRSLLAEDGVIAINYVGDLSQPSMGIVVRTVISVFTNCRIFREDEANPDPVTGEDLVNLVIFCKPSTTSKLEFRAPQRSDYLGTGSRENYLMPKFEVHASAFELQDSATGESSAAPAHDATDSSLEDKQQLVQSQTSNAMRHWEFMRALLPAGIWTSW